MKPQEQPMNRPQNVITKTRQDLVNTGELFKMNGKVLVQPDNRLPYSNSKSSPDSNCQILLRDCCLLFANLALAVASVIALVILIRIFRDEPLADYYEYLLTLRFHWQMIFITCLMPLTLLVPILAIVHQLLTSRGHLKSSQAGQRLATKAKLLYQVLIWFLALFALILVVPFVGSPNLQSKIKLELDKFMRRRYESDFAYRLLDDIQERYECCDHLWYRANLRDQLPLSCFVAGTNYSIYFDRTCSETLSSIVGSRCYLLSGCLFVILLALACLSFIDLNRLLTEANSNSRQHYEINRPDGLSTTAATAAKAAMTSDEFARVASLKSSPNETSRRYEPDEHEGDRPLLERQFRASTSKERLSALGAFESSSGGALDSIIEASDEPVVLARANYQNIKRGRSQSPMFVSSANQTGVRSSDERQSSAGSAESLRPVKSALKKANSNSSSTMVDQIDGPNPPTQFGSLDTGDDDDLDRRRTQYDDDRDDDDFDDYTERLRNQSDTLLRQKQLQREQTRRSLLSVRFADESDA